jgi:parvulin-like peptidyl-prolyl isomerase
MTALSKVIREPLVHFVLIGAAVFGLYTLMAGADQDETRDRIVITKGRVQQLAQVFERTWQRPPRPEELRGLFDAYIKEEVYYREAVKLGLDRDDTVIRRRMQQKLEFLTEPNDEPLQPDDPTLQAYLDANKASFRVEPKIAFYQVFLNPNKTGEAAPVRARKTLEVLKSSTRDDLPPDVSDPTLLQASIPLSPLSVIAGNFGESFAANLTDLPENEWIGPIESPYGLHLVRVNARIDGYDPELAEIRGAVKQNWQADQREAFQDQAYDKLLSKYEVILPASAETEATP